MRKSSWSCMKRIANDDRERRSEIVSRLIPR
jgi:hypothetical protein